MSAVIVFRLVGMSFVTGYPANLHLLQDIYEARTSEELIPAVLVRNPDNEHDSNAIQVHVPTLDERAMIGHMPAYLTARFAPQLDAGVRFHTFIHSIRNHRDHRDRPGIDIQIQQVEEKDNGNPEG